MMTAIERITIAAPAERSADAHLAALARARTLRPFSPAATGFVGDLSRAILGSPRLRKHPETIAFGYWIRPARIEMLRREFEAHPNSGVLSGRGLAFHVAPANVDTIFLYSLVLSLLVGNVNIVRVSSRVSDQVEGLLEVINQVLSTDAHTAFRERIAIVRYGHDDEVTAALSQLCALRVIWGGDATVNAIRRLPLPPRAVELTFADRLSFAVLDADAYLAARDTAPLAQSFFNDSYWFGQMGCSSPRLVFWRGTAAAVDAASDRFWSRLEAHLAAQDPELGAMDFLNKLVAEQVTAITRQGRIRSGANNLLTVIDLPDAATFDAQDHCGGGLFIQSRVNDLGEIMNSIQPRHQTVASFGVSASDWREVLEREQPAGIDRIVPIGEALNFSSIWDGYDLMRSFTREITIAVP